jgi:DNA-binding LacI/PurR family transcriptional regulator
LSPAEASRLSVCSWRLNLKLSTEITIAEIAKEAGVGIATVSRVINGGTNVHKETMAKVLTVIKKYNYNPNTAARRLSKRAFIDQSLGILIPKVMNQFFFELIKAISEALREHDYNILVYNTERVGRSAFEHIASEDLPGLFVFGDPPMEPHEKDLIVKRNIPYIYLDHHSPNDNYVAFDHCLGGALAARYLLSRDRTRITFIGKSEGHQQQAERLRGFKEELRANGIDKISEMYLPDLNLGYPISKELFSQGMTDGLFLFSDVMAYSSLQAKAELRSNVSIIGYDDIFPSKFLGLSTIRQSVDVLARTGVKSLLEMIDRRYELHELEPVQTILKPELVDRDS